MMKRNILRLLISLLITIGSFTSCKPKLKIPNALAGDARFTSYVAIGGSYTSGFADGALSRQGQLASYPNLLAQRMQMAGGGHFNIPLLKGDLGTYPDYDLTVVNSYKLTLPRLGLVLKSDCKGEISLMPERIAAKGDDEIDISDPSQRIAGAGIVFHQLGIPAMKSFHFIFPGFGDLASYTANLPFSPYYWRFAMEPHTSTLMDEMKAAHPSFFTMEIGMNDVLNYAIDGGIGSINASSDKDITRPETFRATIALILDTLQQWGTKGLIANIPDITKFPYFTTIGYNDLKLDAVKVQQMNSQYAAQGLTFATGKNPFVVEEDGVIRKLLSDELVTLGISVDSLKCYDLGALVPIPDKFILSEEEITNIRSFTQTFNQILAEESAKRGFAMVDLRALMEGIDKGETVDGIDLSAEFVSGGFFSLDGLHPTPRGQALIANEFIRMINDHFHASLPLYQIADFGGPVFP